MPSLYGRRHTGILALSFVLGGLVLSACGTSEKHYSIDAMLKCLKSEGLPAKVDTSAIVAGSEGSLDVDYGDHDLYLSFGKNHGEAQGLAKGITAVGSAFGGGDGVAATAGNVMYYSNGNALTANDSDDVQHCLDRKPQHTAATLPPKYGYGSELTGAFVNSCVESGGTVSQCNCAVDYAERRWTALRFMSIAKANSERFQRVIDYCRSR